MNDDVNRIVGVDMKASFEPVYKYISATCGWNGWLADYTGVNMIAGTTYDNAKDAIGQITPVAKKVWVILIYIN